jgi:hypothetical protein
LPSRTTIARRSPSITANIRDSSSGESTTGSRFGPRGRSTRDIQGRSTPSTLPYRNSSAESACRWVEADTFRLFVSQDRNNSTSGPPIVVGWRRSWNRMKTRAQ